MYMLIFILCSFKSRDNKTNDGKGKTGILLYLNVLRPRGKVLHRSFQSNTEANGIQQKRNCYLCKDYPG